ncbi:zinc transport system ATP-binding protein [Halarsenatibacter silvermanii]|uniref:Zinc transport system ATP-binding protein n=1 Tax=Halarsenatibacter silvermanii TaxID=321763 RepID=A0A1G9HB01_9FIRM|nr:zinc transport system ATP-binding protein [Halarsenatibacter silvermanii]
MEAVRLRNVRFSYEEEKAVRDVNLKLEKGDFAAFIGPNGSGKSTVIKMLMGALEPDEGRVEVLEKDVTRLRDWTDIGYISQEVREFNQSFPATVREIVGSNLYNEMGFFRFLNDRLEEKIHRALKLVDMENFRGRRIGNLSGGQQQRVFIARMMVNDPELILLDEPLSGVDIKTQDEFYRIIGDINSELNKTVIMVSHDVNVISSHANYVVCFENGRAHLHRSDEFNYDSYLDEIRDSSLQIVPDHDH